MKVLRDRCTEVSRLCDRSDEGHPERRILDCAIGWWLYPDRYGDFYECEPEYSEPDGDGVKFTRQPRIIGFGNDGRKMAYPVPGNEDVWVRLRKPDELPVLGTPVRAGNTFTWDGAAFRLTLTNSPSRISTEFVLKQDMGVSTLTLPFESQGLTRQGRLLLHDGAAVAELRTPTLMDAAMKRAEAAGEMVEPVMLGVSFVGGAVILDMSHVEAVLGRRLEYPVYISNPPLDVQVGANSDDAQSNSSVNADGYEADADLGGSRNTAGTWDFSGTQYYYGCAMRFAIVTINNPSTIDVAYLEFVAQDGDSSTVVNTNIRAEDGASPNTFVTNEDLSLRTWHTTVISWDAIPAWANESTNQSISIVALVQALEDSYDYSGGAPMAFFWHNDGSTTGSGTSVWRRAYNHDADPTKAPLLHVEFTAGGVARRIFVVS